MPQCPAPRLFSVAVKNEATQTDKNQLPFSGDHRCEWRRRMHSARLRFAAHPAPALLPLRPDSEHGSQITRLRTHSTSTSAAMTTAKMVMSTSATRSQ